MIELAREGGEKEPVHLGNIAKITGLSDSYLSQLAISLRNDGLLLGVSGKGGGYMLARPANEIGLNEIVKAVIGPINLTECVASPHRCLNAGSCEARTVWALLTIAILDVFERYSLADLLKKDWLKSIRELYPDMPLLNPDALPAHGGDEEEELQPGCPICAKAGEEE